jgi:hypothetical protein
LTKHNPLSGQKPTTTTDRVRAALARLQGPEAADEWSSEYERLQAARFVTLTSRAEANAIAKATRASGNAPDDEPPPDFLADDADAKRARQMEGERAMRKPGKAKAQQARRAAKKMDSRILKRLKGRLDAERAAASAMAEQAFQLHGIRHHFRPIPKTAWFAGHMGSYDRDGLLMLEALASCGMPAWRMAQVLCAARNPEGYAVRRHVCTGKRSDQTPHVYDGRPFNGGTVCRNDWEEPGMRRQSHPGFMRVVGCAVFLWMSKSGSRKRGALHVVHGFGRGVFSTMMRCHPGTIFGHDKGMPGAMLALRAVGFVHYHQPPADEVADIDTGPLGHAYNKYWLPSNPHEDRMAAALVVARALLKEMGREALPAHWRRSVIEGLTFAEPEPPDIVPAPLPH